MLEPGAKVLLTEIGPNLKLTTAATRSTLGLGVTYWKATDLGPPSATYPGQGSNTRKVGSQHSKGFNVLFGDFHVEARRQTTTAEWVVAPGYW